MREVDQIAVEDIESAGDRRSLDEDAVISLQESIAELGLLTPITVRLVDDFTCSDGSVADGVPVLVTGAHRLEAVKRLGWDQIDVFHFEGDDEIDAKRAEIAENLHRAELTAQQRSEQIAEWIRLTEEKQQKEVSRQVDAKPEGGRPEGGRRAAARELGVNEPQARRAEKIASISDQAKEAAKEAGLDDNQSALEKVAREKSPEGQVQRVNEIAEQRERKKEEAKASKADRDFDRLHAVWESAHPDARSRFIDWLNDNGIAVEQ